MTCDNILFRFDWETSRREKRLPSTVLPNLFWQILRPFLPPDSDFERSFAQTFAIPEFRAIGDGGARACSKMLSLLTAYKDLPEETARRLVTNDLLIDKLRTLKSDEEFEAEIDSAIAAENVDLAEEKRALSEALEAERVAKQAAVARLEAQAAEAERRAVESEEKLKEEAAARRQHEVDIAKLSDELQELRSAVEAGSQSDTQVAAGEAKNAKRMSRLSSAVAIMGGLLGGARVRAGDVPHPCGMGNQSPQRVLAPGSCRFRHRTRRSAGGSSAVLAGVDVGRSRISRQSSSCSVCSEGRDMRRPIRCSASVMVRAFGVG